MKKQTCTDELAESKDSECPIFYALKIIGQKWKLLILWKLTEYKSLRYNELKRQIPAITNTSLTRCLRELEEFGLVDRLVCNAIPPSVEYSLTDRGAALLPTLNELSQWGAQQMDMASQSEGETSGI